jgi:hypothetical protein
MAIKTFTDLTTLPASDINTYLANAGLVFVKEQTVSGVSSVVVPNAFSATFDNYKITLSGGTASGIANFNCELGATVTGYFSTRIKNQPDNGSVVGNGINNASGWGYFGQGNTGWLNINCDIFNPFLSRVTTYNGSYMIENGASSEIGTTQGFQNSTTSFTGFTLTFGGQTVTGAKLRVYGYRQV